MNAYFQIPFLSVRGLPWLQATRFACYGIQSQLARGDDEHSGQPCVLCSGKGCILVFFELSGGVDCIRVGVLHVPFSQLAGVHCSVSLLRAPMVGNAGLVLKNYASNDRPPAKATVIDGASDLEEDEKVGNSVDSPAANESDLLPMSDRLPVLSLSYQFALHIQRLYFALITCGILLRMIISPLIPGVFASLSGGVYLLTTFFVALLATGWVNSLNTYFFYTFWVCFALIGTLWCSKVVHAAWKLNTRFLKRSSQLPVGTSPGSDSDDTMMSCSPDNMRCIYKLVGHSSRNSCQVCWNELRSYLLHSLSNVVLDALPPHEREAIAPQKDASSDETKQRGTACTIVGSPTGRTTFDDLSSVRMVPRTPSVWMQRNGGARPLLASPSVVGETTPPPFYDRFEAPIAKSSSQSERKHLSSYPMIDFPSPVEFVLCSPPRDTGYVYLDSDNLAIPELCRFQAFFRASLLKDEGDSSVMEPSKYGMSAPPVFNESLSLDFVLRLLLPPILYNLRTFRRLWSLFVPIMYLYQALHTICMDVFPLLGQEIMYMVALMSPELRLFRMLIRTWSRFVYNSIVLEVRRFVMQSKILFLIASVLRSGARLVMSVMEMAVMLLEFYASQLFNGIYWGFYVVFFPLRVINVYFKGAVLFLREQLAGWESLQLMYVYVQGTVLYFQSVGRSVSLFVHRLYMFWKGVGSWIATSFSRCSESIRLLFSKIHIWQGLQRLSASFGAGFYRLFSYAQNMPILRLFWTQSGVGNVEAILHNGSTQPTAAEAGGIRRALAQFGGFLRNTLTCKQCRGAKWFKQGGRGHTLRMLLMNFWRKSNFAISSYLGFRKKRQSQREGVGSGFVSPPLATEILPSGPPHSFPALRNSNGQRDFISPLERKLRNGAGSLAVRKLVQSVNNTPEGKLVTSKVGEEHLAPASQRFVFGRMIPQEPAAPQKRASTQDSLAPLSLKRSFSAPKPSTYNLRSQRPVGALLDTKQHAVDIIPSPSSGVVPASAESTQPDTHTLAMQEVKQGLDDDARIIARNGRRRSEPREEPGDIQSVKRRRVVFKTMLLEGRPRRKRGNDNPQKRVGRRKFRRVTRRSKRD